MHNNLGAVYASARQFDKAEYHYKRALQIKPDFIQPRKNLQALQVMRFR
jgi:Flp pilus assembly protein TadD